MADADAPDLNDLANVAVAHSAGLSSTENADNMVLTALELILHLLDDVGVTLEVGRIVLLVDGIDSDNEMGVQLINHPQVVLEFLVSEVPEPERNEPEREEGVFGLNFLLDLLGQLNELLCLLQRRVLSLLQRDL